MPVARASKLNPTIRTDPSVTMQWMLVGGGLLVILWALTASAISSRLHLAMGYSTIVAGPAGLEPLLSSNLGFGFSFSIACVWFGILSWKTRFTQPKDQKSRSKLLLQATLALALSLVPFLFWLARVSLKDAPQPMFWEPLWLTFWTGVSFSRLMSVEEAFKWRSESMPAKWHFGGTIGLSLLLAAWWHFQTNWYFERYLLGFNDFAHFLLRVDNTANARGLLLESPVLPMFWDHFNPGLLLVVPIWILFPSVQTIFLLQAVCMAGSGVLIYRIAIELKHTPGAATLWSAAWLAQPAVGQMNLAYTHGWHPISIAIPLLLAALLNLIKQNFYWSCLFALIAMSMEEGVIVVVCLFGATCVLHLRLKKVIEMGDGGTVTNHGPNRCWNLHERTWWLATFFCAIGFVLVYRFSGLADFQTGRFVALGDNVWSVMLSPLLRPDAFWGELLQPTKAAYVLCLLIPCFIPSLWHGWPWILAAIAPLAVLLVWDHKPASSLAFQYASALLPIFWLATLSRNNGANPLGAASGAFTSGLILSLFIGQLPYSTNSLADVVASTYGTEYRESRGPGTELGQWLDNQVSRVRSDGSEVLATGRIAAHLIGNCDVETVGQYQFRRKQLSLLPDREGKPITHYNWILIDHLELFQQTAEEIAIVETEAQQAGFVIDARSDDITVWRKPQPK